MSCSEQGEVVMRRQHARNRTLHTIAATMLVLLATGTGAFAQKRDAFYWLSEMNKASAVMVVEQGIVPRALGTQIAKAVAKVIADQAKPGAARSRDYLQVEGRWMGVGGRDARRIIPGRGRQNIGSPSRRLFLRDDLLAACDSLAHAREVFIDFAQKPPSAIVPAYTWGVQA